MQQSEGIVTQRVVRWASYDLPIQVLINPFPGKEEDGARCRELMTQAFQSWEDATMGLLSFKPVSQNGYRMIRVYWQQISQGISGNCQIAVGDDSHIQSANIEIGMAKDMLQRPEQLTRVMLQQVGRALGLAPSRNPEDVMYNGPKGSECLSLDDCRAVIWNYRLSAGSTFGDLARELRIPTPDSIYGLIDPLDEFSLQLMSGQAPITGAAGPSQSSDSLDSQQDFLAQQGRYQVSVRKNPGS